MIHMADTAEQVRFFAVCDLTGTVERYQNVVDCCICGVRFLKAEAVEDRYRLSVEVCVFWRRRHGESLTESAWK